MRLRVLGRDGILRYDAVDHAFEAAAPHGRSRGSGRWVCVFQHRIQQAHARPNRGTLRRGRRSCRSLLPHGVPERHKRLLRVNGIGPEIVDFAEANAAEFGPDLTHDVVEIVAIDLDGPPIALGLPAEIAHQQDAKGRVGIQLYSRPGAPWLHIEIHLGKRRPILHDSLLWRECSR